MRTPGKRVCRKATRVRIPAHPRAPFFPARDTLDKAMRSLLAVVLFFSAAAVWAAEENVTGINALEAAKREFQQRKFDSALATLNDSEKRGDSTAKSLVLKGRIYAEQQKYDEATAAFDAAYKLDKESSARRYLADMLVRAKEMARGPRHL